MMDLFFGIVCFFGGFVGGFGVCSVFWFKTTREFKKLTHTYARESQALAVLDNQYQVIKDEFQSLKLELTEKNNEILKLTTNLATLKERGLSFEEKIQDLTQIKEKLTQEFENVANKIFTEKMNYFHKDSSANLDMVLGPFKEKLGEFQKTVVQYRTEEMKEASSLKSELQYILQLNQKLSTEAHNLTKALKGDQKTQGNWGELILERVLEASGLREGEEYILQGKDMRLVSEEGKIFRPDVIVNLPEGKHVVIDSKVTLNGYDHFVNAQDETHQITGLKEFLGSIKRHISGLSEKEYQGLNNLVSPDFVLMFIPIEGAFAAALQNDASLFEYGWNRKVILVSPTTLMVTLRTIESIWKKEKQNKNALEIARQASDLYDKFAGFMEDLDDLRASLDRSQRSFENLMGKLKTGRGNIVGRFERLKELGLKTSKSLQIDYDNPADSP